MNKFSIFLSCLTCCLLQGCANHSSNKVQAPVAPVIYEPGEFNQESLYDLLLAEIAGQRKHFALAFDKYLAQAQKTRDPSIAQRATHIAQYLQKINKIQQAALVWREVEPQNNEPLQILLSIKLHQGKAAEASPLLQQALAQNKAQTLKQLSVQSTKLPKESLQALLKILNQYREAQASNSDLEQTLGFLYQAKGEKEQALAAFSQALTLNPQNLEATIAKANLLRNTGQLDAASALIAKALKSKPDDRRLHLLYAQLLFQSGKPDLATEQAVELLKKYPKDQQLAYYLALLMLEHKKFASAEKVFMAILELKPNDSSPHFYLGHIKQAQGKINLAIEHYSQVRHGNNVFQALSQAVSLMNNPQEKAKVQQLLKDVRAVVPNLAPRVFTLESEWLNLHNFEDEALIVLEEALSQYKNNTSLLYTRAMLLEDSDYTKAEADFKYILTLEPDNALVKNALGYTLLLHTQRYEEAYQLIKEALQKTPKDPAVMDSMGWALFKLKRFAEAVPYLEQAYSLFPDPEVASHLIQAYWANQQKEAAQVLLKKSQSSHPQNPFILEAEQAISAN